MLEKLRRKKKPKNSTESCFHCFHNASIAANSTVAFVPIYEELLQRKTGHYEILMQDTQTAGAGVSGVNHWFPLHNRKVRFYERLSLSRLSRLSPGQIVADNL